MSGSQQLLLGGIPTAVPVDPYFYSVTSLLHGDGVNGGQNNTFLDSSTNNFTITRNGNTTQGSFSPFSQTGWGNFFDGTGDSLTFTANSTTSFTGDMTLEGWVFFRSFAGSSFNECCFASLRSSVSAGTQFDFGRTGGTYGAGNIVWWHNNAVICQATAGTVPLNQWVHVAWVRSGTNSNNCKIYVNGVQVAQGTNTTTMGISSGTAYIGNSAFDQPVDGYMSNVRLTNTAVYTAAFTPPTTPLTAISGTSLLTCQANRFRDASTNNFTITRNGDVSVQPFSPFNPTTAYSTSAVGGSGYFDGSGDYLSVPSNAAFAYGTGALTIEAFINTTTKVDFQSIIGSFDSVGWFLHTTATGVVLAGLNSGTFITGTKNVCDGAWHHVAMVRSGSTLTLYIDGVSDGAISDSTNVSSTTEVRIGGLSAGIPRPLTGYISSLRVVKGTAVYTANFTPPTTPLTAIANTSLLTNFTNGAIFDNAAVADYETVGNAQISTSVKKYGTGSMAFDGTGDYLPATNKTLFDIGGEDFTAECWVNFNSLPADYQAIFSKYGADYQYQFLWDGANSRWFWNVNSTVSGNTTVTFSDSLSTGIWYHIALVRIGTSYKVYKNGTQVGTTQTISGNINAGTRPFTLGSTFNGSNVALYFLNGYIDDFRFTKGIARYPYNFTPPTAEFPNIGGTVTLTADPYYEYTTLLLPGNGTNGAQNNTFLDSSTNAFSITRNGNTTQGTFSPFSQTGWGNYFDGTGDYLSVPDAAAFTLGTSDFCMESWVYPVNAGTGASESILGQWSSASYGWIFQYRSNALLMYYSTNGSSTTNAINASATVVNNAWNHIAFVRSGNTLSAYVNGVRVSTNASFTASIVNSSSTVNVGRNGDNSEYVTGYLSNTRLVVGSSVYDPTQASFTVPTAPLTAITNTSLLTCQSNRFIDNSTNNFAITRNGDVSVQAFSPFNPTAAWSAATNGGSGYFDGSGDYLTAPDNAALDLSGDFTIEAWVYLPNVSGDKVFFFNHTTDGNGIALNINNATPRLLAGSGGSWLAIATSAISVVPSAWYHIAGTRSGNTYTIWVNGVSAGTATSSGTPSYSSGAQIGRFTVGNPLPFVGYLSSLRVVKGTAVYTTAFTPPTAPLTAITNTSLLLNFTNAGIYDATSKNDLETVGNAQISTTQSKFGGSSMYFDGSGDRLTIPFTNDFLELGINGQNFTVEAWIYPTNTMASAGQMLSKGGGTASWSTSNGAQYQWGIQNSAAYWSWNSSGSALQITNGNVTLNAWQHLAVTYDGTTTRTFLNGVLQATSTSPYTAPTTRNLQYIGMTQSGGFTQEYYGYIQDLRITKGIARYFSNFTPPTTAFLTL